MECLFSLLKWCIGEPGLLIYVSDKHVKLSLDLSLDKGFNGSLLVAPRWDFRQAGRRGHSDLLRLRVAGGGALQLGFRTAAGAFSAAGVRVIW